MSNFHKRFGQLFILSAIGYLLSFANQLVVSFHLGTSLALDSYWALLAFANLLMFYVQPLREALVPPLYSAAVVDRARARALFSAGVAAQLLLSFCSVLFLLLASVIDLEYIGFEKIKSSLVWICFIAYFGLFGLAEICNGILLSFNRVLYQAASRVISALMSLVFLWFLIDGQGILALWISLLVAQLVNLVFSLIGLKKERINWEWKGFGPLWGDSRFRSIFSTLLLAYLFAQIYTVFERNIMQGMVSGLLASYQYGVLLVNVLTSLVAYPVANLLWAKFLANEKLELKQESFYIVVRVSGLLFFILMIICVFVWCNADKIISLVFGRGRFDENSVMLTAEALRSTIFAAIPIGVGAILGRWLISQKYAYKQFWISSLSTFVGMFVIFVSYLLDGSRLILWHFFLASLSGLMVAGVFLLRNARFSSIEFFSALFFISRLGVVVAVSALGVPDFDFGLNKISLFIELFARGGVFLALVVVLTWLLGASKAVLNILRSIKS